MRNWVIRVGMALLAVLAAVPAWADAVGYAPGRGGIGGQIGGSSFIGEGDYSDGARARFFFSGHWRYAFSPSLRFQFSPQYTWSGYEDQHAAPFRDLNFPEDSTKANYLTQVVPITAQLQFTSRRGTRLFHAGAGAGLYRVWIQNRRKVLEDPATHLLHRGLYWGLTGEVGGERFLKSLPSTSVEVTLDAHYVFAERPDQFPSGWNDKIFIVGARIGINYYFTPNPPKKEEGVPGTP